VNQQWATFLVLGTAQLGLGLAAIVNRTRIMTAVRANLAEPVGPISTVIQVGLTIIAVSMAIFGAVIILAGVAIIVSPGAK